MSKLTVAQRNRGSHAQVWPRLLRKVTYELPKHVYTTISEDDTNMDEMGVMFYRERSPLQFTTQLLNKIHALEPSESPRAARKAVRPRRCNTAG